jgi:hypothetical protein
MTLTIISIIWFAITIYFQFLILDHIKEMALINKQYTQNLDRMRADYNHTINQMLIVRIKKLESYHDRL